MADKNDSLAGNFETTAQRMLDALEKASSELSKTVDACVDQLSQFNSRLQKSLDDRLQQIKEQFLSNSESDLSEIESRKERLIDALEEFERSQVETVVTTARTVRESLHAHAQQLEQKISRLVEDQLAALQGTLQAPEQEIPEISHSAANEFRTISDTGKERIDQTGVRNEDALAAKAQEFETKLQELVSRWKEDLYLQVDKHIGNFKGKVETTITELTDLSTQNISDLKEKFEEGSSAVVKAISSNRNEAESTTQQWRDEVQEIYESFSSSLKRQQQDAEHTNSSRLEYKANEAKGEISGISRDAHEKIQASHKVLHNSLNRLEQDYRRRLESIFSRLEASISETSCRSGRTSSMEQRTAEELQEKLRNNLTAQGAEILRAVRKLTEQLETEYVRASRSLDDRVDTIKSSATESLEKQVHAMKSELDKITRSFQHELSDLSTQADELEEAGKAAAVFVMAYRSSLLSLDSE